MWIWWILSLFILIACFIFTYRMIVSSYDFLPADKRLFMGFKRNHNPENSSQQESLKNLKSKLKSVEENNSYYEIQFSKFQQRLKTLEELYNNQQQKPLMPKGEEEENWKEIYYEENEAKEKLENELDAIRQKLEDAENKVGELEKNKSEWSSLRSDYDARLNDLQSMQNNLEVLQRQLEASTDREKEMEQLLLVEINFKKQYTQLEKEHVRLKSENEEVRKQLIEMSKRETEMEQRTAHAKELESRIAIYEEEKSKMLSDLEQMMSQKNVFPSHNNPGE